MTQLHLPSRASYAGILRKEVITMVCKIALIIFAIEATIMVVLSQWDLTALPLFQDLLDATLLTIIASPIIYYGVARPFSDAARLASEKLTEQLEESRLLLVSNERLRRSLQTANETTAEIHEKVLEKIGAELHDGPAQLMTYSILQLDRLVPFADLARANNINVDVEKLRRVMSDALREVRAISTGLVLPELAAATAEESIRLAVRRHEELTDTAVELQLNGLPDDLSLPQKICAYRLVQEALTNGLRHGKPTRQRLTAQGRPSLTISIFDDGRGFDPSIMEQKGLGLSSMRTRVEALGGKFCVRSAPGQGTEISANFNPDPETHG
jgi:signal transduction histidine kinase